MATKVSAGVSYGIGVQNRYSAFLEDEDGFLLSSALAKRPNETQSNAGGKQKNINSSQKSKLNVKNEPSSNSNKKNDAQQKNSASINGQQKPAGADVKRQQRNAKPQVPEARTAQPLRQGHANGRSGSYSQEGQAANANHKYHRNQVNRNSNHLSNASQDQSKENDGNQVFNRGNSNNQQRFNRQRQIQKDERKGPPQDGQLNSHASPANEEEKRRRQQKRALDLKFKDPEKRETRRNQAPANGVSEQNGTNNEGANDESQGDHRGQRNKRERARGPDDGSRNMRGPGFKGPRSQESLSNGERREGQQGVRRGDRPQRKRNGFEAGSRNSQGSKTDSKNQERAKPIPNFSDKSDFPSLAS